MMKKIVRLVNYNVRRYIVGKIDIGAAINIESGTLNLKADFLTAVDTLKAQSFTSKAKMVLEIEVFT